MSRAAASSAAPLFKLLANFSMSLTWPGNVGSRRKGVAPDKQDGHNFSRIFVLKMFFETHAKNQTDTISAGSHQATNFVQPPAPKPLSRSVQPVA